MAVGLHVEDVHAVGSGEGPGDLVTPVRAIRVEVGVYKKTFHFTRKRTVAQRPTKMAQSHALRF